MRLFRQHSIQMLELQPPMIALLASDGPRWYLRERMCINNSVFFAKFRNRLDFIVGPLSVTRITCTISSWPSSVISLSAAMELLAQSLVVGHPAHLPVVTTARYPNGSIVSRILLSRLSRHTPFSIPHHLNNSKRKLATFCVHLLCEPSP